MSPGRLFVVRHGRTAGNGVRYVGWGDEPLDEVGREQARNVAERLAGEAIAVVYSSSLSRAVDTARPIAERHGVAVHIRDELREIDYGEWTDLPKGARKLGLRRHHRVEPMPGGESLRDVFDRVARVRAEIEAELRAGRDVAAVGHYWSLQMLAGQLAGRSFDEVLDGGDYAPTNGSIRRLRLEDAPGGGLRVAEAAWA